MEVLRKHPQALVRIGRYDLDIAEAIQKSSERLEIMEKSNGRVKYGVFRQSSDPYLIIVEQKKEVCIGKEHNIEVTVSSNSKFKNQIIAERLIRETGISLDLPVPEALHLMSIHSINLFQSLQGIYAPGQEYYYTP